MILVLVCPGHVAKQLKPFWFAQYVSQYLIAEAVQYTYGLRDSSHVPTR